MSRIYEYTFPYSLARKFMLFGFRRFYGEFIIRGKENLPNDNSALIFAPNHLNALMDALAISSFMPPRKAVIYLAKADLFVNQTLAKILHFAKIMPAFRMRDGFENLEKNNRVFYECINVLRFGHYLCIMPEGGQGEQRKIRPLVKGIFRVALDAQSEFGNDKKVRIVPVGIDLGDLEKCGKHIIINIGKPIDAQGYIESYTDNPAVALNDMKDELHRRLSGLTLDLATNQNYETFETITEIMAHEYVETDNKEENSTYEKFKLKQETAKILVNIERTDPSSMTELNRLSANYASLLKRLKFESSVFSNLKKDETSFFRFLYLFITSPVFIFGFITNVLPTFLPVWIRRMLFDGYEGFRSSVQFGLGMILFPLFYVLQTVLFGAFFSVSWWAVLLFFFLQYFTRPFALRWYSNLIKYIHKIRFNSLLEAKLEQSTLLYRLITIRNRIVFRVKNKSREDK